MKVLTREKFKVLAEINSWSLAYAEGYVDGETSRRRAVQPPKFPMIGIDEYCLGFRAGYFDRPNLVSTRSTRPNFIETAAALGQAA